MAAKRIGKAKGLKPSKAKAQPATISIKYDGRQIMAMANEILKVHAPEIPPVPSPGRALLVAGLYEARIRGNEVCLDYRAFDDRWIELERDQSSWMPSDVIPFKIIATEAGAIRLEYKESSSEDLHDLLPKLWALFREPRLISVNAPAGFSEQAHRVLCRVTASLVEPFTRGMLVKRLAKESKMDPEAEISEAHVKNWLRKMVDAKQLFQIGPVSRPRYQRIPPTHLPTG